MGGEVLEVEIPKSFVGPIKLKNQQLFGVDRSFRGYRSSDRGRTWQCSGPLPGKEGKTIAGRNARPWSLIRLASGAIALTYDTVPAWHGGATGGRRGTFFVKSHDEGKTWSVPTRVSWVNTPANPTWLIQTKSGRLLLPNEYWYAQSGDRGMGVCTVYYSDDEGQTWRESADSHFVYENNGALIGSVEVPCVAQASDGRLLMLMRTELRRIAQSYSTDGGERWSPVALSSLVSSGSEVWLARIPTTGDLLCVWNQASAEEIRTGFYRARLTSAISTDCGCTWNNFRTITASPGMEDVERIVDRGPPSFLRSPTPVPPKELIPPEGFWMVRAPRVKFVDDKAYLVYTHRIYKYFGDKWKNVFNKDKLRVIPISWFYGR